MYDIIGDVHGYADELENLLQKLGYKKRFGVFHHDNRKAIFLGDFVDRGPDVKRVLKMVKHMVEENSALTILGNHEYNLVSFFTRGENGRFLRPHSIKNMRQVKSSLKAFDDSQKKLQKYLDWFQTLPLFLEIEGLRVIHAAWDQKWVDWLKKHYPENRLTNELLQLSNNKTTKEHKALECILKGVEVPLPKGFFLSDTDGTKRKNLRVKWWEKPEGKTIKEVATKDADKLPDVELDPKKYGHFISYSKNEPPLFLGHYCLKAEQPYLLTKNICCVDFCVVRTGGLTAYRWDGEQELKQEKFLLVS